MYYVHVRTHTLSVLIICEYTFYCNLLGQSEKQQFIKIDKLNELLCEIPIKFVDIDCRLAYVSKVISETRKKSIATVEY